MKGRKAPAQAPDDIQGKFKWQKLKRDYCILLGTIRIEWFITIVIIIIVH
jgi:hypothetical protein